MEPAAPEGGAAEHVVLCHRRHVRQLAGAGVTERVLESVAADPVDPLGGHDQRVRRSSPGNHRAAPARSVEPLRVLANDRQVESGRIPQGTRDAGPEPHRPDPGEELELEAEAELEIGPGFGPIRKQDVRQPKGTKKDRVGRTAEVEIGFCADLPLATVASCPAVDRLDVQSDAVELAGSLKDLQRRADDLFTDAVSGQGCDAQLSHS